MIRLSLLVCQDQRCPGNDYPLIFSDHRDLAEELLTCRFCGSIVQVPSEPFEEEDDDQERG